MSYIGNPTLVHDWNMSYVENMIEMVKNLSKTKIKKDYGNYPYDTLKFISIVREVNVTGKHFLVIGSVNPWIEAILLAEGKKNKYNIIS